MNQLYRLALLAALTCSACRSESPTPTTAAVSSSPIPAAAAHIDPVCGMVRDSTWIDNTVYNGDTLWFCAAIEKKAFLADPSKYMVPKPEPLKSQSIK